LYVVVNPRYIKERVDESSTPAENWPILLSIDGFLTDKFVWKFIMKTVLELSNYFLCPNNSLDHGIVTSSHFKTVNVIGNTKQKDIYRCGNHISMYMINFERFIDSNVLTTQTLANDPHFEKAIGKHPSFQFDGVVDLDQLKAEMRTFFLHICMISSKIEDQEKCNIIIDNIINMFEHTSEQ
jgi:hypothetical protein